MSIKCDNVQKMGVVESNVVRLPGNDKSTSFSDSFSCFSLPLYGWSQEMFVWTSWEVYAAIFTAITFLEFALFSLCTFVLVACTVFVLALQYICQCVVHGRESTECRLQKAWKGNVQKMALELKNGQKNHFFWEMAIGVGLCAQLMKMNYLQRKCAKCSFGCFNKVNIVDRVQKWIIMKI